METKKTIYEAFLEFQSKCNPIPLSSTVEVKTKTGGTYTFNYADLPKIHEIVKPLLSEQQMGFYQVFNMYNLKTVLFHISGETIESSLDLETYLSKADPQTAGGIITYFKRYTLSAILGLVTDEDDDANTAMENHAEKKEYPDDGKIWLNPGTPQWTEAIKWLSTGGKLETVEKKYKFSKVNRELLLSNAI